MTAGAAANATWKRRFSNMELLDVSHLKESDGKRVQQLITKIEAQEKIIFESKNSIDAFIAQKELYQEKAKQKEIAGHIKKMEKRLRHCLRDKKRYQREIQEIDHSFVFDDEDEDEDIDDTASSYRGDESSPVSPQVTKEPLQGEPPILGTTMKRAGSDGISHQLKKAVQGIKNNFVRAKDGSSVRLRSESLGKLGADGEERGISDVDDEISDNLESDAPFNFLSDSGLSRKSVQMATGAIDHGVLKELAGTCRGIASELETVRQMVDERKTDLETKFNAMQHLLHNQAQVLEYMDTRMCDLTQSLYQAVENGFQAVDERLEVLDERIVTEVNILGGEVRDSIVDHESVFQHIQDHEGRIKDIEETVRSSRIDSTRYLSALTPLISAISILIIYIAKASSRIKSYGIGPQVQLAALVVLLAVYLWIG